MPAALPAIYKKPPEMYDCLRLCLHAPGNVWVSAEYLLHEVLRPLSPVVLSLLSPMIPDYPTFRRRQQALLPSYPSTKYKILFSSYALPFIYTWYLFMSPSISIIIGFKCFHNQIFIFTFLQSDERCKYKIKVKMLKNLYLFYPSKPKKKPETLNSPEFPAWS